MTIFETLRTALSSIWANKIRSFLTVLGIIIGIFAVVVLVAAGQGVKKQISDLISGLGPETLIMLPGVSVEGGKPSLSQGFNSTITVGDINHVKENTKYSQPDSFGMMTLGSGVIEKGDKKTAPFIIGVSPNVVDYLKMEIETGREINQSDIDKKERVATFGVNNLEKLGLTKDDIGATFLIGKTEYKLIGVYKKTNQNLFGFNIDDITLMPYSVVHEMAKRETFDRVYFKAKSVEELKPAADEVKALIKEQHNGEEDVTVSEQKDVLGLFDSVLQILTSLLAGIASISLLVGGIGIMNIMLVSVTERTREIGVRKAIGATNQAILWQFLFEAIVLTVLGSLIAIAASYAVVPLIASKSPLKPVITLDSILLAVGVSIGIGLVFGLFPAIRAARKNPIEALRYE